MLAKSQTSKRERIEKKNRRKKTKAISMNGSMKVSEINESTGSIHLVHFFQVYFVELALPFDSSMP